MGSSIAELRAIPCPSWRRGRSATQSARSVVVGGCRSGKSIIFWVWFFPVPSRVVCVRACVEGTGEARHDIAAAPGPQNRSRRHPLQASRHGALQTPQTPKPHRHMRLSRISGFPRIPQNNRTQRGSESHVPVWVSGGLGLQVTYRRRPSL